MRVQDILNTVEVLNTTRGFLEDLEIADTDAAAIRDELVSDLEKEADMLTRNVGLLKMGID